jgi:protein-S-isoprenylcysteine O-methyltransferase Ste14
MSGLIKVNRMHKERSKVTASILFGHDAGATGPYRCVRHSQYIGFAAIMLGFLLQWPTVLKLAMFRHYPATTPRVIPHLQKRRRDTAMANR